MARRVKKETPAPQINKWRHVSKEKFFATAQGLRAFRDIGNQRFYYVKESA